MCGTVDTMNIAHTCVQLFSNATTGFRDLLFPATCVGCGRSDTDWCPRCAGELGGLRRVVRPVFAREPPAFAMGRYTAAARRAVIAYKETGRRALADPFGRALATGLNGIGRAQYSWCVIPAPSRAASSRRRGGSHMTRVAQHMAAALAHPASGEYPARPTTVSDCLALNRQARDSVGLEPGDRLRNLAGRVRVRGLPEPADRVVLIDDVITTGATVACSVDALASAGIEVAAVLALTTTH